MQELEGLRVKHAMEMMRAMLEELRKGVPKSKSDITSSVATLQSHLLAHLYLLSDDLTTTLRFSLWPAGHYQGIKRKVHLGPQRRYSHQRRLRTSRREYFTKAGLTRMFTVKRVSVEA